MRKRLWEEQSAMASGRFVRATLTDPLLDWSLSNGVVQSGDRRAMPLLSDDSECPVLG
jgi:hypothetical protein